jgi:XTP/dITP diphosphohydrolase
MKLVIATRNKHKLKEIQAILSSSFVPTFPPSSKEVPLEIVSLAEYGDLPDIIEDQETFVGNAQKKALETAQMIDEIVIADDSGLSVDALGGEPGVRSARYAGANATYQDLCYKLLKNLENIPEENRTAHFTTVIAVAKPGRMLLTVEGRCDGLIIHELRGTNGFGYDPIFLYPPLKKTFAELSSPEKNKVSHRAHALQALKEKISEFIV